MPCEPIVFSNGARGVMCSRGRKPKAPPPPCRWCGKPARYLCDAPVATGTCDAPICIEHRQHVGPDTDHCPDHRAQLVLKL